MSERDLPPFEDSFGSDSSDDETVFDEALKQKMMGNIRARIESDPMTFEELAGKFGEGMKPGNPMQELDIQEIVMLTVVQAGHRRQIESVSTDGQEVEDFEQLFNMNPTDVPPEEM